jgi:ribosomal protein L32
MSQQKVKCEQCGFEQISQKFCDNCGLMLTRIIVAIEEENPDPTKAQQCKKCGHLQPQGRICEKCGLMLSVYRVDVGDGADSLKRCIECGSYSAERICRNCGVPVPGFDEEE